MTTLILQFCEKISDNQETWRAGMRRSTPVARYSERQGWLPTAPGSAGCSLGSCSATRLGLYTADGDGECQLPQQERICCGIWRVRCAAMVSDAWRGEKACRRASRASRRKQGALAAAASLRLGAAATCEPAALAILLRH
mmetsp:Transcript_32395/g.67671  ORF Transcript_32395/g.67671 Transcript_32395/m.67671 type:complete len:140 (-) Transcript_32395:25-444(-)